MVFSCVGNTRRVFRVLPPAACFLANLRIPGAGRGLEKSVLQECAEAGAGNRRESVSGVRVQDRLRLSRLCFTRNFTMRLTRASGSGLSNGNCTDPLAPL